MTASKATISTAMISFLKRSKKKRVSSATSREEGGAVGINFTCSADSNRASGRLMQRVGFWGDTIISMNALWNAFETLLGLSVGTEGLNVYSNLFARDHCFSCHTDHNAAWTQTLTFAQDPVRRGPAGHSCCCAFARDQRLGSFFCHTRRRCSSGIAAPTLRPLRILFTSIRNLGQRQPGHHLPRRGMRFRNDAPQPCFNP